MPGVGAYNKRTLAEVENQTSGTTTYYNIEEVMDMRFIGIQVEIKAGQTDAITVTVEGTMQDDGTAIASREWQDITSEFFGVASVTSDSMFIIDTPVPFSAIRVKTVSSGGNNTGDYNIYMVGRS